MELVFLIAESKQQDIVKSNAIQLVPYLVAYIITEKHIAALPETKDNSSTLYHNVCPLRANLISDI